MNLFWDTRHLTQAREDHLTCFIAAALKIDEAFRRAYESRVLEPLADDGGPPRIVSVETQISFEEEHSRPDMVLVLENGDRIACEHKIDAPETLYTTSDGITEGQIERYLRISDVAFVTYFRPSLTNLADDVLTHERYLRPATAHHFLWRDLYEPLTAGEHEITRWLRIGFERLGFTPPAPHIGKLWPDDSDEVKDNQRNFGKLWHSTRGHLGSRYKVSSGSRCELYLEPLGSGPISRAYVSPLAQGGSLLRLRVEMDEAALPKVRLRLESVIPSLPVQPEMSVGRLPNERTFLDLLAPLQLLLRGQEDATEHESRLFDQVVPVLDALNDRR